MKQIFLNVLFISLILSNVKSQVISEWRGSGRTGVFNETGLLKAWPEGGPEMTWVLDSLPNGYSSVSVANELIYFTGIVDSSDVMVAVDLNGVLKWQTVYGRSWNNSFNPSRCTPTIEGNKAYVSSGLGDVACLDALTGDVVWQVPASEKYEGTYGRWGISESLLIYGDKLFFTPGGDYTTMVAFNINTGDEVWKTESLKDNPSYTSPLLVEWLDTQMVVTATESYVFCVDPFSGDIRWKVDFAQYAGGEWRSNNQTNTPLFDEGKLYMSSGYDHRSVQFELSEEGDAAYFNWVDTTLDVHHGGMVKLGDYIYGSSWKGNRAGNWVCLEWNNGQVMYDVEWENKGSIISAEGMLYCYEEKNGNIALVKATPEGFEPSGTFKVPHGKGPHWSHLVIHEGVLYVRHGKALMAYTIAAK